MKELVVDASVAIKLFLEEEDSEAAERFMYEARELLAPDLIRVETANVIWKRKKRGELSTEEAREILDRMMQLPLKIHDAGGLVADALELALRFDCTVYDGMYLALAVQKSAVMLTADRRLVKAVKETAVGGHVRWIGER